MEVRWRISGRCKNVTRHKFGGIFGHVMTKISLSKVTIRSYLGLSGGSPPDAIPNSYYVRRIRTSLLLGS